MNELQKICRIKKVKDEMIPKFVDNMWRPRRSKHHRRKKMGKGPIVATEKLEDRTLLSGQDLVAFAQALTAANVTLYGAEWDANTTAQKALLEDGARFLQFVDVTDANRDLTQLAATVGVTKDVEGNILPVWQLNDGTLIDASLITTLQELSTQTNVAIPNSDDPFLVEIADQNLLSGTALHIALDGYDSENSALTYTVESSNPDVSARVLTGNRSIRISVEGYGDMVFELFEGRASRAAERIIELAEDDFYNDVIFYSIINNFVIQSGDPEGTGEGNSGRGFFDDQFHPELQHVQTGLISMLKEFDDTNDSQFFITEGPSRQLDFEHTIFGYLTEGEDVREAISNVSVDGANFPNFTVSIETVDVFTDLENATLVLTAEEGYTGSSTITVAVQDSDGNSQQRQFQVNVTPDNIINNTDPANAKPYLPDIPDIQVSPGSSVQFQLEAIDIDLGAPNGNIDIIHLDQRKLDDENLPIPVVAPLGLTYGVVRETGWVTVSASDTLAPGVYSITFAVGSTLGGLDYQVATVIVSSPPVANDDFFALQGDTPSPIDILSNDTDSDGTLETVEILSQPAHGTVTANSDGTVNFVADGSGYMGLGSFSYRVKDDLGVYSNIATVDFSIAPEGVILVTSLEDPSGDPVTDDGLVTLREAIDSANSDTASDDAPAGNGLDTIMFDPDLFGDLPQSITLNSQLTITDSLNIIAPTSPEGESLLTIDANFGSRHFTIDDDTNADIAVSLQNLKLINGQINEKGGSIFNAEDLEIKNSQLINNKSYETLEFANLGGAIYNSGTLQVSNSLIQSNSTGLSSGGAIASESGSVTLTQTTVDDNESEESGAGIYAINSNISLIDSIISNNTSLFTNGGGLYQVNGLLNITNSSFIGNSNGNGLGGGGVYANTTTTVITGSTFHDNQSAGSGGGLYQTRGTLSVRNSTFSENSAMSGQGGGIFTAADTVSIVNSTISGNQAEQNGGGIYFSDIVTFTSGVINNSTIAKNQANQDGGGLYTPATAITVNNTIIADNTTPNNGTDVLGTVDGSFSLIENTAGVIIQGTDFITGQDPGLLALSNYGGPTRTHALAVDSIAIDAGDPAFDPNSFTPELTEDQRNSARIADGNHDSISRLDIGAYEAESVLGSVDLTVKWEPTNVDGSGEINTLPSNANFIDEWNSIIVEIWVSITNSSENGVASALADFSFDAQYLFVNSIAYGDGFTENQTGAIDNEAGTITGLGASTVMTGLGAETYLLLARVQLLAKPVPLNAVGQYIQPVANLNFEVSNSTLLSNLGSANVTEGPAVNLTLVPALYDLDDTGTVDFQDLVAFVSVYGQSTGDPESEGAWAADFDRSGKVDFNDLLLFVSNYRSVQGSGDIFSYPANFDEVWQQNNLITLFANLVEPNQESLTVEKVEPVLDAAKQQLAETHNDSVYEELADVEIKLVELPENQLAKAEPSTNTIYLDVNAAGWGWFVDQTPFINEEFNFTGVVGLFDAALFSPAEGRIDLLTVLMHELSHLLGHHHDEDHLLMQSRLDPGERKLPEDYQNSATDEFFGSYLNSELPTIT